MQALAGEVQILIAVILFMLLVTSFVIVFVLIHQHQYHKFLQEKEEMKNTYQQEILIAQLEMKEQTLHTISEEIHDNIGQVLSLVKLNLNTMPLPDNSPTVQKIADMKDLVGKAIQDLRNLSKRLNTEHVSNQRLSESLKFELGLIHRTGVYDTQLRVNGTENSLDPHKQLIVFRIVQEALNNIIKHAKGQHIFIDLTYTPGRLEMRIEDDGMGFDLAALQVPGTSEKGTGIGNMQHRAKLIGGHFTLNSQPGKGTLYELSLPA